MIYKWLLVWRKNPELKNFFRFLSIAKNVYDLQPLPHSLPLNNKLFGVISFATQELGMHAAVKTGGSAKN